MSPLNIFFPTENFRDDYIKKILKINNKEHLKCPIYLTDMGIDYIKFRNQYKKIPGLFERVSDKLEQFNQFDNFHTSFGLLDEKVTSAEWIKLLLTHHVRVQRQKPPGGKNPWFEQFDDGSVVIRTAYRRSKGGRRRFRISNFRPPTH